MVCTRKFFNLSTTNVAIIFFILGMIVSAIFYSTFIAHRANALNAVADTIQLMRLAYFSENGQKDTYYDELDQWLKFNKEQIEIYRENLHIETERKVVIERAYNCLEDYSKSDNDFDFSCIFRCDN